MNGYLKTMFQSRSNPYALDAEYDELGAFGATGTRLGTGSMISTTRALCARALKNHRKPVSSLKQVVTARWF